MKVGHAEKTEHGSNSRRTFKEQLARTASPKPPPLLLKPRAKVAQGLPEVRAQGHAQAQRLVADRSGALQHDKERLQGRVLDLVLKELTGALGEQTVRTRPEAPTLLIAHDAPTVTTPALAVHDLKPSPPIPDSRPVGSSVAEVIDRISLIMKSSHRPALQLTLHSFAASVEVEKTGPNEVALKLKGWNGPPSAQDVARVRDGIRQRGLRLSSLTVE